MIERAIRKAQSSLCRHKICAIGIDKQGNIIGYARNRPRFMRHGGSIHAEMALMSRYGENLKTILICRVNRTGKIIPLSPCDVCLKKSQELNIKIISLFDVVDEELKSYGSKKAKRPR